jgi:hypothetical protein
VINVVLKYWGEDIAYRKKEGATELTNALIVGIEQAESRGFKSFIYKSSMNDLKKRIDQGVPLIVIMPGIQAIVQHAMIVSGYSIEERRILTYIPEPDSMGAIPESKFEHEWKQDDMTAIVVIPSDMKDLVKNDQLTFVRSNRMCLEAERMRQQGRINDAIERLHQATEIDSDNAQAWCILGAVYNETNSDQALSCYETTIKLNPNYYLAYRGLGNYYLKRKDYRLAELYYSKAIDLNPFRFGPIYKNRAIARLELRDNPGAKEDLMKYLEQMPAANDRNEIEQGLAQL